MQKLHEAHPVELALLVALAVVEALTVLAVALLALVLTVADRRPPAPRRRPAPPPAAPAPAPAAPLQHPLALVAEALLAELQVHPVVELRRRARQAGLPRQLSRSGRRADLIAALAGMEVAVI